MIDPTSGSRPPATFDLIQQSLACNKIDDQYFDCNLVPNDNPEDITSLGKMDSVVITGDVEQIMGLVSGNDADFFISGELTCKIIMDDNIFCNKAIQD